MNAGLIPEGTCRRLYDLLIEHAGASASDRAYEQFLVAHTRDDGCREYRFGGTLGFGGKFRNDAGPWRVDCYREDETPARRATIERTNAALLAAWNECLTASIPTDSEPPPPSP